MSIRPLAKKNARDSIVKLLILARLVFPAGHFFFAAMETERAGR